MLDVEPTGQHGRIATKLAKTSLSRRYLENQASRATSNVNISHYFQPDVTHLAVTYIQKGINYLLIIVVGTTGTRVFADRPARRRSSAHAKYSVSHHMVIKPFLLLGLGLAAQYRSRRWVWSTVVRRPSEVYDAHRRTKLTAPETISRYRDVVDAHQNLNGSRGLTTPFSGMVYHPWTNTCYRQPTYQIWSL